MPTLTEKPKRRRRLPRWSMRAMFVGITIVCVVMGLVVRPAEEQRRAVAALKAIDNVTILYDYEVRILDDESIEEIPMAEVSPPGPAWLRELIGIDYFADVVYVSFLGSRIRDEDLRQLVRFKKLKSLNLSGCAGVADVCLKHLTRLASLTELSLGFNELTAIPLDVKRLSNLKTLNLTWNQFSTLPPGMGRLTKLTELYLGTNRLTTLPQEIGQLTKLTWLDLSVNGLTALPPEIGRLTELDALSLCANDITSLPREFGNLTKLTWLDISDNQLTTLPPQILMLANLTDLNLRLNQLTKVHPEIGRLTKLTELDLSHNQLTTLPPEIGSLTKLTNLYIGSAGLTKLPPEIGQLTKLEELSLAGNAITDADLEHLKPLKNLKKIWLEGTKATKEGIADFQQALPNCNVIMSGY